MPIECSYKDCKSAYHTTCAIRSKLKMQAIFGKNFKGGIKLRSYCKDHCPSALLKEGHSSPKDKIDASGLKEIDMTNLADDRLQGNEDLDYFWKYVDVNQVHKSIVDSYARVKSSGDVDKDSPTESKSPYKKSPIAKKSNMSPKKSIDKIKKGKLAKPESQADEVDPLAVDLIYRYWMLLRTANNGQSLIKFSPSALKEREFEQRKSILKLRIELERVRNLSYMIGKREKLKASWLRTHQNIIRRTFSVINDLNPPTDQPQDDELNDAIVSNLNNASSHHHFTTPVYMNQSKRSLQQTQHLQPPTGIFDESEQLVNDLTTCDQIYDEPGTSASSTNHSNLSYQEQSTLERRRTLSLVRRINRQLKSVNIEPSMNPYAKNYMSSKRSDSPVNTQSTATKMLKNR